MISEAPSVWEEVWDRFNGFMAEMVTSLRAANQDLWIQIGHNDNEFSPFHGYASFIRDGDPAVDEEDVVVTLDYHIQDGRLRATVDICRGYGGFLAEHKQFELGPAADLESIRQEILHVELEAERYILSHARLLWRELT